MKGHGAVSIRVIPRTWPLAAALTAAAEGAVARLELGDRLVDLRLVADAMGVDDRAWFRLETRDGGWRLDLWFHPDQVLQDRPGRGALVPPAREWQLGPVPAESEASDPGEFSTPNAQRFLYQQLTLAQDIMDSRLDPSSVPAALVEAFQEAWLITIDGRLQRLGLPHLSAGERRSGFMRLFSPAGILTPRHWSIFNALWEGDLETQAEVLDKVRVLPPLSRRSIR